MSATFWNMRRRQAAQELKKTQLKQQTPVEVEVKPEQLELKPEADGEFTELVDMPEEAPVKEKLKRRATKSKVKDNE